MIMRIIVYCRSKTVSQKSPTELYEKVAKTWEDVCSEKWSKAKHSREMERERRRVWGAKRGVFGRLRHEMGTKGREEKKRGGTPWAATAFRHVTFLFTSGCNTHDPHYWLSLTPFHRHIRAVYAQARMWTHKRIKTRTTQLFFFPARLRKVFIVSSLYYLIKLLSSRAAVVTQLGGWRYSKLPHFLGDSALLHVPMRSQGNPIPIFRGCSHTEEQEVQRRLNLRMCVVSSASMHVSLEGREAGSGGPSCVGENDEAGSWDVERQVDGPRDTDWLSPLRAVQWQVGASIKNHATHACATVGTLGSSTV